MAQLRLIDATDAAIALPVRSPLNSLHLNDSYLQFRLCSAHSALLEVRHPKHGWQPVYSEAGTSVIIRNPLKVDCAGLCEAVLHTLQLFDARPSYAERQSSKLRTYTLMRQQRALELRRHFYVVRNDSELSAPAEQGLC